MFLSGSAGMKIVVMVDLCWVMAAAWRHDRRLPSSSRHLYRKINDDTMIIYRNKEASIITLPSNSVSFLFRFQKLALSLCVRML